ncbi:hypothetical protein [Phytomonospora endophytica]|uniref:Uncharacterized protein n=1 Tax=Phytomonospora endophytica TaxID=714109 RepID=A0A841FJA7_9ACTN|nr:hypothetical protein [Phytomonospora endophytica]MBB6032729.1 hypothetical protein [Phytomonospora endophytica]
MGSWPETVTPLHRRPTAPATPSPSRPASAPTPIPTTTGPLATVPLRRASELPAPDTTDGSALPVVDGLGGLLPWGGLRRGAVVGVAAGAAPGMTTLLLALLAGPSAAGSWCGIVGGGGELSALAIAEAGVDASRLPLVPDPGAKWPEVTAALLDGLDVVAVHVPQGLTPQMSRRLSARARKHKAVLVPYGADPDRLAGADVVLRVVGGEWRGLGSGRGRLRERDLVVSSRVRGRPVRATMRVPGFGPAEDMARVVSLMRRETGR